MQYPTPLRVPIDLSPPPVILRLAPRRIMAWLYITRMAISTAVFLAAVLAWQHTSRANTLVASLTFVITTLFTAASAVNTEVYRRRIGPEFLYGQMAFDTGLITAIVHLTWDGSSSLFVPLYILLIAIAALVLPAKGVTLVSALAIVLYVAEAVWIRGVILDTSMVLQLVVFCAVAFGSGAIAARLREAGAGREALVEELARFRLKAADVEQLHVRAERLEAIAEMSASMAHEIKNPLASIRSAVEQLAVSPRTTNDERTLTSLVQRESDRLARLLTGFLDFAKVDRPYMRRLDVISIIRSAAELAASHPDRATGVRVEYEIPHGALYVRGDEDMLHRTFFNLLLNAVQASPEDSTVCIEATTLLPHQLIAYASTFSHGAVAVRVVDRGPGIPSDVRDKVFHPFFTTKPHGSGLGLAIVHRAVEAHRGAVVLDSDLTGTRCTVLLPTE